MKKPKVLFVGAFVQKSKSGHTGGQMFACNSLINSRLSDLVDWHLIDTTATTNQKRSFIQRIFKASLRFTKFGWALLTKKVDTVLLFASYGFSFREKGIMLRMARFFGKKTIIAPRSGLIKNEVAASGSTRNFVADIIRKADRVICQGPSWKTYYSGLSGDTNLDKFVVIHNWLDARPYLREHLPEKKSAPVRVVYLGWVNHNKGIFDLLDAVKLLRKEGVKDFVVDVAGNGDAFDEAVNYAQKSELTDIVDFKNWVMGEAKIDLFYNSDIYVLPSYREGYPNSLLEAMSCGLPPVATSVGAIPDVIRDGENGYLFAAGDVVVLKEKLQDLIQHPEKRATFGANAKATVLRNNTVERAVQTFSEVFQGLSHDRVSSDDYA